jgi:hypothetical protein
MVQKIIGRVFYGMAAALGVISLGVEIQAERQRRSRNVFARPPTQLGIFLGMRSLGLALIGKIIEDAGREPSAIAPTTAFGIGKSQMAQPQTLRSSFDRGDLLAESAPDRRSAMSAR